MARMLLAEMTAMRASCCSPSTELWAQSLELLLLIFLSLLGMRPAAKASHLQVYLVSIFHTCAGAYFRLLGD